MKHIIYADNAATTKLDVQAFEAMQSFLLQDFGNASQPYSFSKGPKTALKNARATIASCIHAEPDEIFFTSGGTESDNWAIKGLMCVSERQESLITTRIEHHAVLNSAASIERFGRSVVYLPVDTTGTLLPRTLLNDISDETKLVSVMMSNNEIGTIQPIKELTEIAHEHRALFHTDAVQSVGHIPINVKALGVDMLSASAHKFNGPKGVGFLYIKKGTPLHPIIDGGKQEFGMRPGTENVASIVGMATALKNNTDQIEANRKHINALEETLLNSLTQARINYIRNGSHNRVPGNISLSIKGADGEMLLHRLDLLGICVSTGAACDSSVTHVSHVLRAINLPEEYAIGTIRISLSKDNSKEEAERIARSIIKILKY